MSNEEFRRLTAVIAALIGITVASIRAHDPATTKVTWNGEIERIVQARCVRCHAPDGRGPMPLMTWEEARPWAKAMKEEVLTRRMPKWHAARGYGDFSNDPSLSSFEIMLISSWADGGAPKGPIPSNNDRGLAGLVASGFSRATATPPRKSHARTLPCGTQPIAGRLLAIRPQLQQAESAQITAELPDGRREIVAWIRNFDPEFTETYWLRTPLDLPPRSRLSTVAGMPCSITVWIGGR